MQLYGNIKWPLGERGKNDFLLTAERRTRHSDTREAFNCEHFFLPGSFLFQAGHYDGALPFREQAPFDFGKQSKLDRA